MDYWPACIGKRKSDDFDTITPRAQPRSRECLYAISRLRSIKCISIPWDESQKSITVVPIHRQWSWLVKTWTDLLYSFKALVHSQVQKFSEREQLIPLSFGSWGNLRYGCRFLASTVISPKAVASLVFRLALQYRPEGDGKWTWNGAAVLISCHFPLVMSPPSMATVLVSI